MTYIQFGVCNLVADRRGDGPENHGAGGLCHDDAGGPHYPGGGGLCHPGGGWPQELLCAGEFIKIHQLYASLSIFFVLFHCFRLLGRSGIDEELQQDTSFTLVTLEPSLEGSPLPIFKEILATTDHLRKTGNPTISKGGRRITKFGPKAEKERAAVAKSRKKKKERELEVLSRIEALEAENNQLEANIVGLQEQLAQFGKITAAHLDQQPEAAPLLGMRPY